MPKSIDVHKLVLVNERPVVQVVVNKVNVCERNTVVVYGCASLQVVQVTVLVCCVAVVEVVPTLVIASQLVRHVDTLVVRYEYVVLVVCEDDVQVSLNTVEQTLISLVVVEIVVGVTVVVVLVDTHVAVT